MSDDIVGNFDTKIKEVLTNFRHKNAVQQAFEENLGVNRVSNEELAKNQKICYSQHLQNLLLIKYLLILSTSKSRLMK